MRNRPVRARDIFSYLTWAITVCWTDDVLMWVNTTSALSASNSRGLISDDVIEMTVCCLRHLVMYRVTGAYRFAQRLQSSLSIGT